MKQILQLKDFFLGKTDAKNELIENSYTTRDLFCNGFLVPENINIDDFYSGKRYFITGLKGTGKTALLHYLDLNMRNCSEYTSSFILFKTDFTDEDKSTFSAIANTTYAIKNSNDNSFEEFTGIWQWFLHRQIVINSKKSENGFFYDDKNWKRYCNCVLAPNVENEQSGIMRLFPKVKRGSVEISSEIIGISSKIGLDFEWENKEANQVKFSYIVKQANELFKKLKPTNIKSYIYIDELELTLTKQKQYQKDIKLLEYYYKEDYVSQVTYLTYMNSGEDFDINNILILSEGNLIPLEEFSPIVKGLLHSGTKKEKRVFYGVIGSGVKKYV